MLWQPAWACPTREPYGAPPSTAASQEKAEAVGRAWNREDFTQRPDGRPKATAPQLILAATARLTSRMSLVRNRHRASSQSALRVRPPGSPGAAHPEGPTRGACGVRGDHWGGGQSCWRGGQGLPPDRQGFVQPEAKAELKAIQLGQAGLLKEVPIRLNRPGPYSTLGHHLQACSGSLRATTRSPPQPGSPSDPLCRIPSHPIPRWTWAG